MSTTLARRFRGSRRSARRPIVVAGAVTVLLASATGCESGGDDAETSDRADVATTVESTSTTSTTPPTTAASTTTASTTTLTPTTDPDRDGRSAQDDVAELIIDEFAYQGVAVDEDCVREVAGGLSDDDAEQILAAGPAGDPDVSPEADDVAAELIECGDLTPIVDQVIADMVAEFGDENVDEGCIRAAVAEFDVAELEQSEAALTAAWIDCITYEIGDPGSDEPTTASPDGSIGVGLTYDIGGRGDLSFNDSAAAGIERAATELGIGFTEAEPSADGSDRGEVLQLQANENDLVIGVGFLFYEDVATVARSNPDTNFAVVDDAMLDFASNPPTPICSNCAGLTFAEEEGSFLVGAAAALASTSGTVGFLGGVSGLGLIEKSEAGFVAGAQAIDPDITVIARYVTEAPDFDGFVAPDRARDVALEMYDDGADVIFHAAGLSGVGLFDAAAEHSAASGSKVWAIGNDSDQYLTAAPEVREHILTSMIKRVDNAVFAIAEAQQNGTFEAGNTVYDLSDDGLDYSTSGGFLTDGQIRILEDLRARVIEGTVDVPTAS